MISRILKRLKRDFASMVATVKKRRYKATSPVPGSPNWLIKTELKYGGIVTNVPRNRVSVNDPRSVDELKRGGMTGGDRMFDHGYASVYAEHLGRFIGRRDITLVEFGILKGTGLAIWCDLFPTARVIGLDIDPEHFRQNLGQLVGMGAFLRNQPIVREFDQLGADGKRVLREALESEPLIHVAIDDGLHSLEAIRNTFTATKGFLAEDFVYFIEDFPGLKTEIGDTFDGFSVHEFDAMTVVTR